jgi:hypothetical protein
MGKLLDPFTPLNFPDLFTTMWVGSLVVVVGAIAVYNLAQRRYRRYPAILALHEWVFWSIIVTWGIVPLLVVVHVPLLMLLLLQVPGLTIAAWATFRKFPPIIAEANDEIRRRRFVPPPRRETRIRRRATPTGGHRAHRR